VHDFPGIAEYNRAGNSRVAAEEGWLMSAASERAARLATLPFESASTSGVGHFTGFFRSIGELWVQRELMGLLVRRELKAKYKDSSLGFAWTLIRPLVMLLIYYFAIGKILGAERAIPSYAIFVFSGLTIWGLFAAIVSSGTSSIIANAGLIKKVYLPREIFPLAATGSAIVDFLSQFAILVIATLALRQPPLHFELLGIFPALAVTVVYGTAIGILLSALNVYLRDVQYLVEVGLNIFFWVSPIVYSFAFVHNAILSTGHPILEQIYLANPMSVAMLTFQRAMWIAGQDPSAHTLYPPNLDLRLLIMLVIGLVFLAIVQRIFARLQGNFAQEI
jgi:ABC-2 type transport system permease protein